MEPGPSLSPLSESNHINIESLLHISYCRGPCQLVTCRKMKRVVAHGQICKKRPRGGCRTCKGFIDLCWSHAQRCVDVACPQVFCAFIKQKLSEVNAREQALQMLRPKVTLTKKEKGPGKPGSEVPRAVGKLDAKTKEVGTQTSLGDPDQ